MKKLLLLVAVALTQVITAQNFSLTNLDTNEEITSGAVFEFTTLDIDSAALWFGVTNTSDQPIEVMVEFLQVVNTDGQHGEFCLGGNCFSGIYTGTPYYPANPVALAPGASDNTGKMWNYGEGTDPAQDVIYELKVSQVDDNQEFFGEFITFTYIYRAEVLNTESFTAENDVIVYPTITENELNIISKTALKYNLYSMNGQALASGSLSATENVIDTANLSTGFYILNFQNDEGIRFSKKFMKK